MLGQLGAEGMLFTDRRVAPAIGAVELGESGRLTMVVLVGLLWATAFPLLVYLAKRQSP